MKEAKYRSTTAQYFLYTRQKEQMKEGE